MKPAVPVERAPRAHLARVPRCRTMAVAAVGVLICVAALAAGCGSKDSGGSTGASGGGNGGASGLQPYLSCLSKNGVTIQMPSGRPTGGPGAGGFPSGGARPSGFPTGGPGGFPSGRPGGFPSGGPGGRPGGGLGGLQRPDGVDDATWQKAQQACASLRPSAAPGDQNGQDDGALRAYRNCLTNHGVSASAATGTLDSSDPTVAAAQKACVALLPSAAPDASGNG